MGFVQKGRGAIPYLERGIGDFCSICDRQSDQLSMLYQIDGNYFMLLYSMLILGACRAMVYFKKIGFYPLASKCLHRCWY